jgi:membrane protein implicated in regulation of membrane protease activity
VLTLYLSCLIFGLGLFVVQMFASSDADHVDAAGDAGHGEPSLPLLGADAAGDHAGDAAHAGHPAPGGASVLLSLRFYMFVAIAFGVVGTPVTAFELSPPLPTFVVALLTALAVGLLASVAFRAIGRQTLGAGITSADLQGQIGRVLVACGEGRAGKVRLTVRGQLLDMVATTDEGRLEPGTSVIVQEVHAERVHVCAAPGELLLD